MGDYGYFGTPTTYTTPYGSTYSPLGAVTGLATVSSTGYGAPSTGTTYTSYAINTNANTTNPTYVDWASAATAAAISSAAAANKPKTWHTPAPVTKTKQPSWYNRYKATNLNKSPPKTYYCETCKVSCMGSLTYKEHCNGQKHKKKEASVNDATKPAKVFHNFGKLYCCELCDINCTGEQAFSSHMSGMKHNKTVMLFKRLGKSIPQPTMTTSKGEKVEVNLDQIKEDLAKRAERIAKEEVDSIERKNKRAQQSEERAKKRMEDVEERRKIMEERRAKWQEERWKREEEWRNMQEDREEEWRAWQEAEQSEIAQPGSKQAAGFSAREGRNLDNKLIMKLHTEIYPESSELTDIKNLVKVTEDTLKTISDKMREETETELKEKGLLIEPAEGEEPIETRVLKGCVRIGDLANGLLQRGDKALEVLVFCTDKPTLYMLQNVKAKFEETLTEAQRNALKVEVEQGKSAFKVTDKKGYNVTITMTSKAMEAELTAATITADVAAKVLDRKSCIRVLDELKHTNWFQANITPAPSAVIALRVLKQIFTKEDKTDWKLISPWLLHIIVGNIIKTSSGRRYSPSDIIRRMLECVSSGILYLTNGGVYDPCTEPPVNLITPLSLTDVEIVTMAAQHALRELVFNKLHVFMGAERFVEEDEPIVEEVEQDVIQYQEGEFFEGYDANPIVRAPPRPVHGGVRPPPGRYYGGPPPARPGYGPPSWDHMGPHPFMRGPRHFIRRGGPHQFGPQRGGFGGPRGRGGRPNNRKRKQPGDDKAGAKKGCKEGEEEEVGEDGGGEDAAEDDVAEDVVAEEEAVEKEEVAEMQTEGTS